MFSMPDMQLGMIEKLSLQMFCESVSYFDLT